MRSTKSLYQKHLEDKLNDDIIHNSTGSLTNKELTQRDDYLNTKLLNQLTDVFGDPLLYLINTSFTFRKEKQRKSRILDLQIFYQL